MMKACTGAALALAMAGALQAEPVCDPGQILSLSERILRERSDLGGFQPPRYGAQSAYLLYHYGGLDPASMLALLAQLGEGTRREAMVFADDMALALAVSQGGIAALEVAGQSPEAVFAGGHWHLRYAILHLDAGQSYFRLLQAVRDNPDVLPEQDDWFFNFSALIPLIQGLSDEALLEMSRNAEAANEVEIAVLLAANMQDAVRLEALMAQPEVAERLPFEREQLTSFAATWAARAEGWREAPEPHHVQIYDTSRASALSGPSNWMAIGMNMTGATEAFGQVARGYLAELEAGRLDPWRDPEAAWVWQYRELIRVGGRDLTERSMAGYTWPSASVRHFADIANISMDYMLFFDAVVPVMDGGTWPAQPAEIVLADWQDLRGFVESLAEDPTTEPATERAQIVGFELLWRAGQYDAAVAFAEAHLETGPRLAAYRDVARRMDGMCDGVLTHPGQALLLGGQLLFKFPPAPYE